MKVLFLFGPNLSALGRRDPETYGSATLEEVMADVSKRAGELGHELEWRATELEVEALLVTRLPNVRYVTGVTGSNGQALITSSGEGNLFLTDGRYTEQSRHEVPDMERDTYLADFPARIAQAFRDAGVSRVGF